jgi:hypothetical protein
LAGGSMGKLLQGNQSKSTLAHPQIKMLIDLMVNKKKAGRMN